MSGNEMVEVKKGMKVAKEITGIFKYWRKRKFRK